MVGGPIFHRDVIQREISRALVLNLSGKTRCSGTAEEIFVLDNAFALALIEGQPPVLMLIQTVADGSHGTRFKRRTRGRTGVKCWTFSKSNKEIRD